MGRTTKITFPNGEHADITTGIISGSLKLSEILSDDESLMYGNVCSNKFQFNLIGDNDFAGVMIRATIINENNVEEPLFYGKVLSCTYKKANTFTEVVAYDMYYYLKDINVINIYNDIFPNQNSSPPINYIRTTLLTSLGIEEVTTSLINDGFRILKNMFIESLTFEDMIKSICQINGVFGNINREGKFEYISLSNVGVDITDNVRGASTVEAFLTTKIDRIEVLTKDNGTQYYIGTGNEVYRIKNNFTILNMPDEGINNMLTNLYNKISLIQYTPAELITKVSDLSLTLGTLVKYNNNNHYVLTNELFDIQLYSQEIGSKGSKSREDSVDEASGTSFQFQEEKDTAVNVFVKDTPSAVEVTSEEVTLVEDTFNLFSGAIPAIIFSTQVDIDDLPENGSYLTLNLYINGVKSEKDERKLSLIKGYNLISFNTYVKIEKTGNTLISVKATKTDSVVVQNILTPFWDAGQALTSNGVTYTTYSDCIIEINGTYNGTNDENVQFVRTLESGGSSKPSSWLSPVLFDSGKTYCFTMKVLSGTLTSPGSLDTFNISLGYNTSGNPDAITLKPLMRELSVVGTPSSPISNIRMYIRGSVNVVATNYRIKLTVSEEATSTASNLSA